MICSHCVCFLLASRIFIIVNHRTRPVVDIIVDLLLGVSA